MTPVAVFEIISTNTLSMHEDGGKQQIFSIHHSIAKALIDSAYESGEAE